jgi:RNA polymerase sigma-70 factor, ECF subfamily
MTTTTTTPFDELVRQAGWLRRLAAGLVRDPDVADDLVQESLIAGWQHPPAEAPGRGARGWLATVARNRMRNWMRAEARRGALEREVSAEAPAVDDGPVALMGQVEIHRLVAEVVDGLAEPYRETLILHYYDGVSSAEVARRLDLPAGTVRWRLKEALDRVRRELDRRCDGDRRVWVRALAPLLGPPPPAPPSPAGAAGAAAPALPWLVVVAVAGLAGAAVLFIRCQGDDASTASAVSSTGGAARAAGVAPSGTAGATTATSPFPDLAACLSALTPLRAEVAREEARWRASAQAGQVWGHGAPNMEAARAIEPLVAAALADAHPAAGLTHTVECRTWACRVILVESSRALAVRPVSDAWEPITERLREAGRAHSFLAHIAEPARDQLSGKPLAQQILYLTLAHPSGEASGPPVPMPPLPSTLSACDDEVARLQRALVSMRADVAAAVGPRDRFRESPANTDLTAQVQREIDRVLAQTRNPRPEHHLECRGRACRLTSADRRPADLWLRLYEDPWFRTRYDDYQTFADAFYVSFASRPRADGRPVVAALLQQIERAPLLGDCGRRHRRAGRLKLTLGMAGWWAPPSTDDERDGLQLKVEGDLGDTPLGDCVRTGVQGLIERLALPPAVAGHVAERWVTFDGRGGWTWSADEPD